MTRHLHVTLAQLNPIVGDLVYNRNKILEAWKAAPSSTDLIIFPELIVTGYPAEDLILKPFFMEQVKRSVEDILKESAQFSAAALVSCPWIIDGETFNAVHLIEKGKIVATRTKHHLPNYGVFDERRTFTAGPLPEPIPFRDISLGVLICEDMWFSDVAGHLKKKGADILIIPNASPFDTDKTNMRLKDAQARVEETKLPLIYVNQIGGQDELVFDGASFILNEGGKTILRGDAFEEGSYHAALHLNKDGTCFAAAEILAPAMKDMESIYEALVLGLRDYITKNGFPGVLLGISGGVDSALVAALAVDALGPRLVHGVLMPSRFTSKDSIEDSKALTQKLGMNLTTIGIEEPVNAFCDILNTHFTSETPSITFENIQPRTRGVILMALSNAQGSMVLSTGNKSEMAVGYATLYGDMCGGFNPLKDIYKTQVYALCRWRNAHKPDGTLGPAGVVIPERILTKAPTAELKDNQTDQDTLPPYDKLDDILACLVEHDLGLADIMKRGHARETVLKVWKMLDRAEYKRRQAPPGIKITTRAFGRERRYPITNHFMNIVEK